MSGSAGPQFRWLAAAVAALLACFGAFTGGAQERAEIPAPVVRLAYRSLQPGEPLLVLLESASTVRSAAVTFLDRTAELRPAPDGGGVFAFLGIDLQTKPGAHALIVKVVKTDGTVERVEKELLVVDKDFPSTKLTLKAEYVTPPASVLGRIKRESELIALAMSVVTPEWLGDGPFALPHVAPSWSNFGQRRLNNNVLQSLHTGLDLRVPFGESIKATNAGRVAMASDLYMGGKTVIIDHGLGVFSSYGHLSELLVKRGEAVTKGQTVGLCGSTGRSTGPHLHWAFKILGARVDPEAMLRLPL
ncbi:MAG TPA: M23 family metallopeptidase [Candidatus Aminicenantes bacterium]|nr:M23 family metallopeptidase [Candidatus Aminicenantes bacterium]HDT14496.1 M23 family metallopeptidase [Candidatus Aminicenantes bacterium]